MNYQQRLIEILSDGKFHSGEELGKKLGISRSAICHHVQQLSHLEIEVHRVKGKGYRIPNGIELLVLEQIKSDLSPTILDQVTIVVLPEVSSTNQFLIDRRLELPSHFILLAEYQSEGRGRSQKKWYSPFGVNLYCSLLWKIDKDPSELKGLSLATGVAVTNALERYGISKAQLKWPNDILYDHKKLSGILIEMTAETHSHTYVIIGIGLNVSPSTTINPDWIDVAKITGKKAMRNQLATLLIEELIHMLAVFKQKGLSAFRKHWQMLDAYYNLPVTVMTSSNSYQGIAKGIGKEGELILIDENNQETCFLHGEVSVRACSTTN